MKDNNHIVQNLEQDGIDRRGFLKCMAWAGTGVLWTVSGGVLVSRTLAQIANAGASALAATDLSFLQISDSHIGFNKDANKDVTETFKIALDRINAEYRAEIRALNPGRWGELNTKLHLHLMSRADQPRTLAIVTALLQNTERYTRLQLSLTSRGRMRAEKEHMTLVRLCRTGDVTAACKLLAAHIQHAEEALVAFIAARAAAASMKTELTVRRSSRQPPKSYFGHTWVSPQFWLGSHATGF